VASVHRKTNGFFTLHVETAQDRDFGTFTLGTGPLHLLGEGRDVLFGGGRPGTSFITIRDHDRRLDLCQARFVFGDREIRWLGPSTSFSTMPDGVRLGLAGQAEVDLRLLGNSLHASFLEVATTLRPGPTPTHFGVRYVLDFRLDDEDAPRLQLRPDGAPSGVEQQLVPAALSQEGYALMPGASGTPLNVAARFAGAFPAMPIATRPSLVQYASWPDVALTAFDYEVRPGRDLTSDGADGANDSALVLYWGHDPADPVVVPPNVFPRLSAVFQLRTDIGQIPTTTEAFAGLIQRGRAVSGIGLSALVRATVPAGTPKPVGRMVFLLDGVEFDHAAVIDGSAGVEAGFEVQELTLTATYSGDLRYAASRSPPFRIPVLFDPGPPDPFPPE
jgi:hypothetical protein